jgi:hypothetical protein
VEARDGVLWFAGDDSLVQIKDPGIEHLRGKLGFTSHTANAIHAGHDGDYYVGTDNGLFCFWNGQFHHITSHPELQHRRIFDVSEDDGGNLWLSTQTGILSIPKRELLAHIANPKSTFSLSSLGKQEGIRKPGGMEDSGWTNLVRNDQRSGRGGRKIISTKYESSARAD